MSRFIAEISSNHNGDLKRCLDLIRSAASCGCWGVKFQLFRIEHLFAPEILQVSETHRLRRRWELPLHFLPDLATCARDEGLKFGCTPFDLEAVKILQPHVDFLKVASYELPWLDLIRQCGETGLPLMISCGMAEESEIVRAVETAKGAGSDDLTVFHCVSNYPVAPVHCNLAAIGTLKRLFPGIHTGWSDHSVDPGVVSRAVNHWNCDAVEFHFDLEGRGEEFSAGHCWLPEKIQPLISGQKYDADPLCDGQKELCPTRSEFEERLWRADPSDGLRPTLAVRQSWPSKQKCSVTKPRLVFRPGGPGLGHLFRLLAIAETLRMESEIELVFVIHETPGSRKILERNGLKWHPETVALQCLNPDLVVLDFKEPCENLIRDLKNDGITVVTIDRPDCLQADLVIIPCFGWNPEQKMENHFGGTEYLLLRNDIVSLRPAKPPTPDLRIVVSFGGEDPNLLTEKTASALTKLSAEISIQFIIGPDFRKHRQAWPPAEFRQDNFQIIETNGPLETIIPGAGLVITAMGVTISEAHVLGVPVAVLTNYRSDQTSIKNLSEAEVVVDLGYHADLTEAALALALQDLWNNSSRRLNLAARGLKLTDGLGAQRAARLIAQLMKPTSPKKGGTC